MSTVVSILDCQSSYRCVAVHTAADMLGVSRRLIRHLIETGRLPATRRGLRAWAIRVCDIETLRTVRRSRLEMKSPARVVALERQANCFQYDR